MVHNGYMESMEATRTGGHTIVHVAGCTCGQQGICTRCVLASLSGDLPAPYAYYACSVCGHVETRQSDVEAPAKCERCGTHHSALVNFGDLDAAEAMSEEVTP